MSGRAFASLRDAIFATASASRLPMKAIASELDWSPSDLAHRIGQGGESARPFPADDDHFVKLMRVTGDHSPLYTLCELLGYDPPQPRADKLPERMVKLTEAAEALQRDIRQLVLDFKDYDGKRGRR